MYHLEATADTVEHPFWCAEDVLSNGQLWHRILLAADDEIVTVELVMPHDGADLLDGSPRLRLVLLGEEMPVAAHLTSHTALCTMQAFQKAVGHLGGLMKAVPGQAMELDSLRYVAPEGDTSSAGMLRDHLASTCEDPAETSRPSWRNAPTRDARMRSVSVPRRVAGGLAVVLDVLAGRQSPGARRAKRETRRVGLGEDG